MTLLLCCVIAGVILSAMAFLFELLEKDSPAPEILGGIGALFLFYPVLYFFLSLGG